MAAQSPCELSRWRGWICCLTTKAHVRMMAVVDADLFRNPLSTKARDAEIKEGPRMIMGKNVGRWISLNCGMDVGNSSELSSGLYQQMTRIASKILTGRPVSSVCDGGRECMKGPTPPPPALRSTGLLAASKTRGHLRKRPTPISLPQCSELLLLLLLLPVTW